MAQGLTKKLHAASAVLFVALGVVHTLFTFTFATALTQRAVWFAGSGLAMIFAGFLNIARARSAKSDKVVRALCHTANALLVVFGVLAAVAVNEPQAYVGIALIIVMAATTYKL